MFVKLLALLISNVFVSLSVLVCCRSFARRCGLKGGIEQRTNMVPVSALECKGAGIKHTCSRARRDKIMRASDRAHKPRSSALHINPLSLCCPSHRFNACAMGFLSGYVCLSALPAIKRTYLTSNTLILSMNKTSLFICKLMFWEAPLWLETLCSSLCNPSKRCLFY